MVDLHQLLLRTEELDSIKEGFAMYRHEHVLREIFLDRPCVKYLSYRYQWVLFWPVLQPSTLCPVFLCYLAEGSVLCIKGPWYSAILYIHL